MRELNYRPNSIARSLQGKKMKLVGLIFPEITNPFFAELVQDIETTLFQQNYKVILCNAGQNKEKEREYLRMLQANQVDGIIAGAHNLGINVCQLSLSTESYLIMFQLLVVIIIKASSWQYMTWFKLVVTKFTFWAMNTEKVIRLTND